MKFFIPKEPAFAEHFEEMSVCLGEITAVFREFALEYRDFEGYWQRSKDIEHKADGIAHGIISLLNKSFITPFDREDIYRLIHEYDDIIDLLENALHNIYLYDVPVKPPFIDEFAALIGRASEALSSLVRETFEKQKYTDGISKLICLIHDLEDDGDVVYHRTLQELFRGDKDPIAVIKWKDILTTLEKVMDVFQKMSNTVEGIVVKGG